LIDASLMQLHVAQYLRYIAVQSCSQWPKEQQPLIFKDKHQCWSTVFRI